MKLLEINRGFLIRERGTDCVMRKFLAFYLYGNFQSQVPY